MVDTKKLFKFLTWVINSLVVLLFLWIAFITITINSHGPEYASGGMALIAPGIFLLLLVPVGLILNLIQLYKEHKEHIVSKITVVVVLIYTIFILYPVFLNMVDK